jgi:hypothetical protein
VVSSNIVKFAGPKTESLPPTRRIAIAALKNTHAHPKHISKEIYAANNIGMV